MFTALAFVEWQVALGEMKAEDDAKLEPEEPKVAAETKSRMTRLV